MDIDHVVFDVGNVLFRYTPEYIIEKLIGNTPHKNLYLESLFFNPIWYQLDRGDLTPKQALNKINTDFELTAEQLAHVSVLLNNFAKHLIPIEETHRLFNSFCETHKVYILSNFQEVPFNVLANRHPFLKKAHGTVVSANIKMAKPEKRIYEYLLNEFSLKPERTLFIDDLEENIKACREVGMNGIVYKTPEQLHNDLNNYTFT